MTAEQTLLLIRINMMSSQIINVNHLGVITYKQEDFPKGIGVLDLERGSLSDIQKAPWQIDDRLEDNVTWCIVKNPKYRSPLSVIQQLCDVVSKNGNLLLNVGPKADGSFPEEAKQTLYEIGNWLQICGEAIFETRPFVFASEGPTKTNNSNYDIDKLDEQLETGIDVSMDRDTYSWQDFRFTQKGNAVYAITFGWPEKAELVIRSFCINGVLKNIREVTLLGHEPSLLFTQQEDGLHIKLPHTKPCNYAYAFRILV
ncbi:MAG: alpha-L-fucosidase [Lachnospiraceae bacterium]